jgi:MoaA/NifB/PqqE/SkfB family radical SAM enzyme
MTSTPKSYEHLVETVHGLKAIGYPDRLIIGFEHMIGRNNNQEYKFIQYKANRENIGITFTMEQEAGYYQNINGGIPKLDIPRIHLTVNPIDIFKNTILLNSKRKAGCVAGDYSAWVTPDLNVYPCLFSMPDHKSFNLKDTDFNIKPRYFLIDKQWINKCSGCWTPCESFTMLLWRPWRIIKHGN